MGSVKAVLMAITLLTLCLLATNTSEAYQMCCTGYMTKRIPFKIIRGYSLQKETEMCSINAIIFHTKRGKACTNPELRWVNDYIQKLSKRAKELGIKKQ